MAALYVVSTPIGNLEDITIRAIKTLFTTPVIACEDTRKTGQLLKLLRERYGDFFPESQIYSRLSEYTREDGVRQQLVSYYDQNEKRRIPEILNALKNGLDVALVSDAGTPLVSDPGFPLVRECVREGINVVSVPGASSILSALTSSGLPPDKFFFVGYPPKKSGNRTKLFESLFQSFKILKQLKATIVMFEAPHKLVRTLGEMKDVFGDIDIVLARELTKVHEEMWRGQISEALEKFEKKDPKGEFVVMFNLQ